MWFWSNLPDTISAEQIADLYRRRWSIEGMFQRLESVLDSEIESLGSPRAALLGFASAILAYNVLAVLKRSVEQAHRETQPEGWEASTFHLAVQVRSGYEGMQIALPSDYSVISIDLRNAGKAAAWHWPGTSSPSRSPKAYAAPKSPSPRNGWRERLPMLMCRPTGCLRPIKGKHLERAGCKSETASSHHRRNGYVPGSGGGRLNAAGVVSAALSSARC